MPTKRIILGVMAVVVCANVGVCFGAPVIVVEPNELNFTAIVEGSNPVAQTLYINNGGTGKLEWVIEPNEPCAWINFEPTSGTSFGELNEVTVSVDITSLYAGEYSCELMISDPDAENSPQSVKVYLLIHDEIEEGIWVPYDYTTIQAAIDAAVDGDEVIYSVRVCA